jgi:hypothetical protein
MTSGAFYYVVITLRRQAVLAPAFVFFGLVAMVYASDAGPPIAAATVPAAALVPVGAWVMRLVAGAESKPFADVTLTALGSSVRRHLCRAVAAALIVGSLSAGATVWARVANPHPYPLRVLATVFVMSFVLGLAGAGLGSLFSPPLGATAGIAAIVVTFLVLLSLVVKPLPPIGPVLTAVLLRRGSLLIALAEAAGVALIGFVASGRVARSAR